MMLKSGREIEFSGDGVIGHVYDTALTNEELVEVADFMIQRWTEARAHWASNRAS